MGVFVNVYLRFFFEVISCFVLVLSSFQMKAQQGYMVYGKASVNQGELNGIEARLKNGDQLLVLEVNPKGEFRCELNWQQDYLFIISKHDYITKTIRFSTEVPLNIDKGNIEPYMLLVELSPVMLNVDTAYFENPVGFIRFNTTINDFDYDRDYSLKVKYSMPVQKRINDIPGADKTKVETVLPSKIINDSDTSELVDVKASVPSMQTSDIIGLPLLQKDYPPGITREEFALSGKKITRVVINKEIYLIVLLKVKHDWGATFYFINEAPGNYRSISHASFSIMSHEN